MQLDGKEIEVRVRRGRSEGVAAPRLCIASYVPNELAWGLLGACLNAIERVTPEAHEVWVVDNNSPQKWRERLLREFPNVSVAYHGEEIEGSYANAFALEIGRRLVDPATRYFMSLHMDTMPVCDGWLSYLQSKLVGNARAAGVRMDTARTAEGVLHVLGMMVDFQTLQKLNLEYWPDLPGFDVGDKVTVGLREAGHDVFACQNTLRDKEARQNVKTDSRFADVLVDRALDDGGNVIFLHLGRGLLKARGTSHRGLTVKEWVALAERVTSFDTQPVRR